MSTIELLAVIRPIVPAGLADVDRDELSDFTGECTLAGYLAALRAGHGREVGDAVYAILARRADKPNSQLAPNVSRAVVSKIACRHRRALGLPVETPKNARAGRKAKQSIP